MKISTLDVRVEKQGRQPQRQMTWLAKALMDGRKGSEQLRCIIIMTAEKPKVIKAEINHFNVDLLGISKMKWRGTGDII